MLSFAVVEARNPKKLSQFDVWITVKVILGIGLMWLKYVVKYIHCEGFTGFGGRSEIKY